MNSNMTVIGDEDVFFLLSHTGAEMETKFARAIEKWAGKLRDDAKLRTLPHVVTGRLYDSIDNAGTKLFQEVWAGTSYARYVEFGTATHPPAPYLMPAFDAVEPKLVRDLEAIVNRII
jgi:HK97 gp10 family phage protein